MNLPVDDTEPIAPARKKQRGDEPFETPPQGDTPRRASLFERYLVPLLSGSILTRAEVRKQYPYLLFMALLMWLYIANIFHVQKLYRQQDRLTQQVKELRAQSLTLSSTCMMRTRQSEIIRELERRNIPLREALTPPKVVEK